VGQTIRFRRLPARAKADRPQKTMVCPQLSRLILVARDKPLLFIGLPGGSFRTI